MSESAISRPIVRRFSVRGQSMRFYLPSGSRLRARPAAAPQLAPGDIIVLLTDGASVASAVMVHRLLWKTRRESGWILWTKGDARPSLDPPCPETALIGRVVGARRPGRRWVCLDRPTERLRHRCLGLWSSACFAALGAARASVHVLYKAVGGLACLSEARRALARILVRLSDLLEPFSA